MALFENQYPVQPMGVSYNSYVILDEKIAVVPMRGLHELPAPVCLLSGKGHC